MPAFGVENPVMDAIATSYGFPSQASAGGKLLSFPGIYFSRNSGLTKLKANAEITNKPEDKGPFGMGDKGRILIVVIATIIFIIACIISYLKNSAAFQRYYDRKMETIRRARDERRRQRCLAIYGHEGPYANDGGHGTEDNGRQRDVERDAGGTEGTAANIRSERVVGEPRGRRARISKPIVVPRRADSEPRGQRRRDPQVAGIELGSVQVNGQGSNDVDLEAGNANLEAGIERGNAQVNGRPPNYVEVEAGNANPEVRVELPDWEVVGEEDITMPPPSYTPLPPYSAH